MTTTRFTFDPAHHTYKSYWPGQLPAPQGLKAPSLQTVLPGDNSSQATCPPMSPVLAEPQPRPLVPVARPTPLFTHQAGTPLQESQIANLYDPVRMTTNAVQAAPLPYAYSDDKIDIRRIPTKWLWEHPLEAKEFLDSLYRTYFQFYPIDDVIYHMYTHPDIKVPDVSQDPNYRPTVRLAADGKNLEVAYVDLRYPGLESKTHVQGQTREEWLDRSTFFDAYLHLFDVNMYDAINNDSYWQIQKKVTFYLDLVSSALALAPAFTLSAALFGSEGSLNGVLEGAASDGFLSTILMWAGLTVLTHSGDFRDHPLGLAIRSVLSWVALVRKIAENEIFTAFRDYLSHDPKNYFHAKHLRATDIASKYLKILFPYGIPIPNFTNVELELWKDIPNTFKWYNRVKELISTAATKAKTPSEYVKNLVKQVKPTLTWAPQTSAIVGRILLHYVANAVIIGGLGTASGITTDFGELALVTGAVTALGTAIHVYIDKQKQISPALGLLYRRINSFILSAPALLGVTLAANDILPYPAALASSFGVLLAIGAVFKAKEKEVIRFFPQKIKMS